jgi:hypothetical protein
MSVLVLGLLTTWLAAGSLGWLAPPLQKSLTWLALAAIVIIAVTGRRRMSAQDLLLLGGSILIAVLLTAFSLPVVNILAVAVVLATVAHVRQGSLAKVSGAVALAATVLAVFRLACEGSAAAWTVANSVGDIEGLWAGWLSRRPLLIGPTFGGVDFLVLMSALTVAWLIAMPRLRSRRAAWAMLFIVLAQTAYLVILACHQGLVALLPQTVPKFDDLSHLGIWTWGNALRTLIPWNLPLLAAVFQCLVAVGMFGLTESQSALKDLPEGPGEKLATDARRRSRALQGGPILPRVNAWSKWRNFAPSALLIVAAIAMTLSPIKPDLKGRQIVAYDDGATDWSTTDPGDSPPGLSPRYGLVPVLVQSLGGHFVRSRDLENAALQGADVLIVLPPRSPANAVTKTSIPADICSRIDKFVSSGGRVIIAGEPETNSGVQGGAHNALLDSTAMSFRDDTANSLTQRWEDNLQSAPHAATASSSPGRSQFSFDRAASIRVSWPAGPLITGRWAWDEVGNDPDRPIPLAYTAGNHLGDLVLAAQQNVGRGTVVALGSAACLSNDGIPFSYTFIGPLLSTLAANHPTPLVWWRQWLGLIAASAAIVLLFRPIELWPMAAAEIALALAVIACTWFNNERAELLPAGTKASAYPIIYVDGSHTEAMGNDPWDENGIGRLMRVLAASNYLPLVAPDLSIDRLNLSAMLISIAPGRAFSSGEISAVHEFVAQGGFFLSTVGSPDAGPSQALLEKFEFQVPPMPIPPSTPAREPTPLGRFWYPSPEPGQAFAEFYAAWPVSGRPGAETWTKPVIVGTLVERGQAYVIGDSAFALNKNFDPSSPNAIFWRARLAEWIGHPASTSATGEPAEGGIISLPKSSSSKGVTP